MRIIFIGSVEFSRRALEKLVELNAEIVGICTLRESKFNSDFCDLSNYGKSQSIPCRYVENINSAESVSWIREKSPDIIFCFGWSRLLKREVLSATPMGVLGFHPAALPQNRGRHPLIWALVLGLSKTASTFFFMDEGADSGDILSQKEVSISDSDDARSLYDKISYTALVQIEDFLPKLISGNFETIKQNSALANTWRKRGAADGKIDWRMSANSIHNLVRGLTEPYIGAHFVYQETEIKVWKTEIVDEKNSNIEPGKIIDIDAVGVPAVKCGEKAIRMTHFEPLAFLSKGLYL